MKPFLVSLLIQVLADERVQNLLKNYITLAVSSAVKAVVEKVPGIEMVGDVADVAADVRTELDRLIPDFDTGIKPLDELLDIWRPR